MRKYHRKRRRRQRKAKRVQAYSQSRVRPPPQRRPRPASVAGASKPILDTDATHPGCTAAINQLVAGGSWFSTTALLAQLHVLRDALPRDESAPPSPSLASRGTAFPPASHPSYIRGWQPATMLAGSRRRYYSYILDLPSFHSNNSRHRRRKAARSRLANQAQQGPNTQTAEGTSLQGPVDAPHPPSILRPEANAHPPDSPILNSARLVSQLPSHLPPQDRPDSPTLNSASLVSQLPSHPPTYNRPTPNRVERISQAPSQPPTHDRASPHPPTGPHPPRGCAATTNASHNTAQFCT